MVYRIPRAFGRLRVASVVALVAVASGCGSTAQFHNSIAEDVPGAVDDGLGVAPGEDGLNAPLRASKAGGIQGAKIPGERAPGTGVPGEAPGTGIPGEAPGTGIPGEAPGSPDRTSGRGYTKDKAYVGYQTFSGADALFAASGGSSNFGDQKEQAEAIIKYINDRGGVAGRKLEPVFYDIPPPGTMTADEAQQAACTRWTQDRPVFAVVAAVLASGYEILAECLARHQTPLLAAAPVVESESKYSGLAPFFYGVTSATQERLAAGWMGRMSAVGYFSGWNTDIGQPGPMPVKVGILYKKDTEWEKAFTRVVQTELDRQSRSVARPYGYSNNNDMQTAVQKFKDAGVTHVITYNVAIQPFSIAAQSQNYHPRYTVTSFHSPRTNVQFSARGQLRGALGIGWAPANDVPAEHDPGDPSPAAAECRKVMENAGQPTSSRDAWNLMTRACDGFNMLVQAVKNGGLSPQGIRQGVGAMGSMAPVGTFALSFKSGRFDGLAAVRDMAYRDNCNCFVYTSQKNHGI